MSKNLKHYRRKKFFYRWFLRRDPRGGAMFGLAWTMMVQALVPFGIFAALRMAGTSFIVTALRMSESFLIFAVLLVTVFLTLYLYGTLVCIFGLAGMLRRTVRPSWLRELMAFFGGWFPQLLGLVLLPTLIRKRRFAAIAFALLGTALCAAILVRLPLAWSWLGALSYLAALALAEARGKCDRRFLYPLAVAFAAVVFLMGYDVKLQLEVKEEQSALSQELGHSVSTAAFWERETQGFPVTKEPLKSLIAHTDDIHTPNGSAISREAAKKMLDECRSKRPALGAALDRFLKLPVSHVAHEYPENGLLAGMRMPELSAFRRCAVYLCCVIVADPGNRTTAAAANRALIRLREWQ
ncbi:MAG: hypothetical protein IJJ28_06440, partial [Lentisphaeria bacterium]|nr:hypothetical protein [Lentisphaeria bacterium]